MRLALRASCLVLAGFMMLASGAAATSPPGPPARAAVWEMVAELTAGVGPQAVRYELQVEGGSARGPESVTVWQQNLYVLDSVNRQVHCLNPRGELSRTIELPFTDYPLDLVRTPEAFYVLDDSSRVFKVSPDGRLLHEYELPRGMYSHDVYRLVADGDRVKPWALTTTSSTSTNCRHRSTWKPL